MPRAAAAWQIGDDEIRIAVVEQTASAVATARAAFAGAMSLKP